MNIIMIILSLFSEYRRTDRSWTYDPVSYRCWLRPWVRWGLSVAGRPVTSSPLRTLLLLLWLKEVQTDVYLLLLCFPPFLFSFSSHSLCLSSTSQAPRCLRGEKSQRTTSGGVLTNVSVQRPGSQTWYCEWEGHQTKTVQLFDTVN